jgi:hypothetical protein
VLRLRLRSVLRLRRLLPMRREELPGLLALYPLSRRG